MLVETYSAEYQRLLPAALEEKLRGWLAACAGAALCAGAAAGWLSLVTWSADDPSLTLHRLGPTRNLLGHTGAVLSDLLLQALGFTAVFLLFALAVWGLELLTQRRIGRARLKAALLPFSLLALATGCSALPTAANWPLHSGFGGLLGDFLYNGAAGLLGTLLGARAGHLAGLVLFSGGLAAFTYCLGLTGQSLAMPGSAARRAAGRALSGLKGGQRREPRLPDPAAPSRRPGHEARAAAAGAARAAMHEGAGRDTPAPRPEGDPGPAGPSLRPAEVAAGEAGGRDADFDLSTDVESRAIAARFAPANAHRAAAGAAAPDGVAAPQRRDAEREAPDAVGAGRDYRVPSVHLLARPAGGRPGPDLTRTVLRGTARLLEDALAEFGIDGEIKDMRPGPVVTLFELEPAGGTNPARVVALAEDIARSMATGSARIAPLPGDSGRIAIELPNPHREAISLRELLEAEAFRAPGLLLPIALGKSTAGEPVVVDLARMPHLLLAGSAASGTGTRLGALMLSLLYRFSPAECRFLVIDPTVLELAAFEGIPHLVCPRVTDPRRSVGALNWVVREMEERAKRMARLGVRDIEVFNNRVRNAKARGGGLERRVQTGFDRRTGDAVFESEALPFAPMPRLVVIVTELADVAVAAGREFEAGVERLARSAAAVGIHLVLATQRPAPDIVTAAIRAALPARIAGRLASKVDSRAVLDEAGAEQLLEEGDMLLSTGSGRPTRVHGPLVASEETEAVLAFVREQAEPAYIAAAIEALDAAAEGECAAAPGPACDGLYERAVALVVRDCRASVGVLGRRLGIGRANAADLIARMQDESIIGPADASGWHDVLGPAAAGRAAAAHWGRNATA